MNLLFLRYFFICICTSYCYCKLIEPKNKPLFVPIIIPSLFFTISSYFYHTFSLILPFILTLGILYLIYKHIYKLSISIYLLSVTISFSIGILILSSTLISIISFFIFHSQASVPYTIMLVIALIIGFVLSVVIFNVPQFKKGLYLLVQRNKLLFSSTSVLFILIYVYFSFMHQNTNLTVISYINISFILISLLLLYYWRHRIKQTYIENMRRLETLTFENTIVDKDKQIKTLEDNNAYLGRIIHKYRKTIPAMELSVMELLQNCETLSPEELKTKAESLQTQLIELQEDRDNLLDKYQKEASITTHTGLHTVDAMLALMEKRAKQEWIRYKTQINPNIRELATASIKEADLLHLLGDLSENAFHAVSSADDKDILIQFGKLNDYFLLEISDSGTAFDIQTYQIFGMEPSSSHTEDGGTGTGLMDIWKIKKEYKASLYIYEYENNNTRNPYTKKISFLFDSKNHFLLKTYRDKEIKNTLLRGDLYVFPHKPE